MAPRLHVGMFLLDEGGTVADMCVEEYPHMRRLLGHDGAILRLANAYQIQPCTVTRYLNRPQQCLAS